MASNVYYAVLTGQRKTGEPLLESQLKMLKDPQELAKIGFEAGMGFIPFGGVGTKVFKTVTQDKVSPVRAGVRGQRHREAGRPGAPLRHHSAPG